jgi:hypothetical protein
MKFIKTIGLIVMVLLAALVIFAASALPKALLAQTEEEMDSFVHISVPAEGATLFVGKAFTVKADVEEMPFALDVVQIELLNPHTKYMLSWQIKNPNPPNRMTIEETLEIPSTTLPGNDYRLSVSGFGPSRTIGLGYSIKVKVVALDTE